MTKTRLIALLLALALMAALVAGCSSGESTDSGSNTGTQDSTTTTDHSDDLNDTTLLDEDGTFSGVEVSLPLVTEPTTLEFWWPSVSGLLSFDMGSAEDYLYFVEMEKRTGVHVEIEVSNDAQTQFGILMASGEYPDFIEYFGNYYTQGLDHAIEEELIVALEDYAEYMPNIMGHISANEDIRRQVTTDDGHLPGIPNMYMRRNGEYYTSNNWAGYVVRQDWLDEQSLEVPTTYDELTNVLEVFKTNYSDTAIPFLLSGFNGSFMLALGSMFWSGYGFTADWMQIDGEVLYSPVQDSYKQYLQMLNNWYESGYLDPDFMSKTVIWTDATSCVSDQFGVFPIIYTHMDDILAAATAEIPEYALSPMAPLKVAEGDVEHVCFSSDRGSVNSVVMADSEHIELVCQWWDYLFSPEGIILANYGIEGEHFEYDENGNPTWIVEAFTSDDPSWNLSNLQYKNLLYNTPGYVEQDREFVMVSDTALDILEFWNANSGADWNYPASATMTASESEDYASVMNDITTYVNECAARFLVGDMSFDEWDSYVASIEAMGLDTAIECKQAAMNRYNAR